MNPGSTPDQQPEEEHLARIVGDLPGFSQSGEAQPKTRAEEIERDRGNIRSAHGTRDAELVARLEQEVHENGASDVSFPQSDLRTLVALCCGSEAGIRCQSLGIQSKQGLLNLRQYIELRILEESYKITDDIVEGQGDALRKAKDGGEPPDLTLRKGWLPLTSFFQEAHIQAYMKDFDIGGAIYASAVKYVSAVQPWSGMDSFFGPRPAFTAHLTCTDKLEDALISSFMDNGGFFSESEGSYRVQWPYETDPGKLEERLEIVRQQMERFEEEFAGTLNQLADAVDEALSFADVTQRSDKWRVHQRAQAIEEHCRELVRMEGQLHERHAEMLHREQEIGGRVALIERDNGSVDVIFSGTEPEEAISLCDDFLSGREAKMYLGAETVSSTDSAVIIFGERDVMSPHVLALLHGAEAIRQKHRDEGNLDHRLLLMQLEEDTSQVSVDEYVQVAQDLVRSDAQNQREGIKGMLRMVREIRERNGLDLRKLFGSFDEFRACVVGPYAEMDSEEGVGYATYLKGYFRGERDNSIIGWMDHYGEKAERKVCSQLTEQQKVDFDKFVDSEFDVPGLEKELHVFWDSDN